MKILNLSLLTLMFFAGALYSQEEVGKSSTHKDRALTLNIGAMAFGAFEVTYLNKVNRRVTITVPVSWYDYRGALYRPFSQGYGTFIGFGTRIHMSGHALAHGLFIEPLARVGYVVHPRDAINPNGNVMTRIGVSSGYSHVFSNGILLEGSVGLEHYFLFGRADPNITKINQAPLRPVAQLSIGYAW